MHTSLHEDHTWDLRTKPKNTKVYSSYKIHLLDYTDLRLYCETGIYMTHEKYILYFLRSTCKKEEFIINTVCQHLMTDVLLCLLTCLEKVNKNLNGSFWYNIMQFTSSSLFQSLINILPEGMRSETLLSSILFSPINHFEVVTNECTSKENNIEESARYSRGNPMSKIQRFVGWAIRSRSKIVDREIVRRNVKGKAVTLLG